MVHHLFALFFLFSSYGWAQTAGSLNYNTTSDEFEFYNGSSWISADNGSTGTGCVIGDRGKIEYNTLVSRLEFCDGSFWRSMEANVTATACSTAGQFYYNTSSSLYVFCNGSFLVDFGPPDVCLGDPTIGTSCSGGAIYAGIFDGGKYMITPGNCTDSATPTCDGSQDSLTKTFRGTSGSNSDLAAVENMNEDEFSSPNSRGAANTAALVADASISSDSGADYCNNMTYGGYSDWFLPSKSEMGHIYCHAWSFNHLTTYPETDPDCVQYGGKSTELTDFDGSPYVNTSYITSSESFGASANWAQAFWDGGYASILKSTARRVRCARRYGEEDVDKTPDSIAWSDFSGTSTAETLSNFDESIFLELTAANGTGAPTLEYQINSAGWNTFAAGSNTYILVRASDTLQFRATGTSGHSATITVKNATDDATTPTLDTAVATVP